MTIPNFLVAGTAKSGTTTLATYFTLHPEVCFSKVHESNYFAFDHQYSRGLSFYRSLYNHYSGESAIGEKSWRYSCNGIYPLAIKRIIEDLPNLRIIYVARDPLERAISMWRELRDSGQDLVNANCSVALTKDTLILDSMRYESQLKLFECVYGNENILLLFFEDFRNNPQSVYDQICDFLEISRFSPASTLHENISDGQRSDRLPLELVRQMGLDGALRKIAPERTRAIVRRLLKQPIGEVKILAKARESFLMNVRDEAEQILERGEKSPDFWTLS